MGPSPAKSRLSEFHNIVEKEASRTQGAAPGQSIYDIIVNAKEKIKKFVAKLIPKQRRFLDDKSKRKGAVCTRRAGKTYVVRLLMVLAVLNYSWDDRDKAQPFVQYIAQTRSKAKDLVWAPLKQLCEAIGLPAHWDDHEGRATFPNGVVLRLNGADKMEEIDKLLGDAYVLAVVDESASFGPRMEELVLKALASATMDYSGTIALVGTPGEAYAGLFYEIYMGKTGWTCHRWSYRENPSIGDEEKTDEWIIANVGPLNSPRVRRECFGEWVADASSLVYYFDDGRCGWDGVLPRGFDWRFLLGMDLGFRDPVAMVVGAYAPTHSDFFIVETFEQTEMLPGEIADQVQSLRTKYPFQRIVVDTGGSMALSNMEEWNRRFAFGMIGAKKTNKHEYIRQMNSEMAQGRVKCDTKSQLAKEWKTLIWAPDEGDSVRHDAKSKEHPGFPNHLADAALYCWRESLNFRSKEPIVENIVPGSEAWYAQQQALAKAKTFKNLNRRKGFRYEKL